MNRFCRWITEQYGREPTIDELREEDLRRFQYSLAGRRPRTIRGLMHAIQGLFALAVARGWRSDNPTLSVKLPKKDAALRATCADDQLEQLLRGCEREADPIEQAMLRGVLAVFIYDGLPNQELRDLYLADLDLNEGALLVRSGKGSKRRRVFVGPACVRILREWLATRPPTDHPYLFATDRRRRLGQRGLSLLMARARALADLGDARQITPHAIRHAAATRLLRQGADLRSIQGFLGHADLETTAAYLHTDEEQLRRVATFTEFAPAQEPPRKRPTAVWRRDWRHR